jgi:uncharacterized OB-fold protein
MTLLSDAIATELPGRPVPFVDADNKVFYDGCARGELWMQRCVDTGKFQFYPRPCSIYTGGEVEWVKCAGRGTVHTFTVIRRNYPEPYFVPYTPYVVAIIDLEEGVRMMSNVTGCALEDVKIGLRVGVYFGCINEAHNVYLPFWRPLAA